MTLRMQCSMILVRSPEPAHLCVETEAPFTAISSSRLKDSAARRRHGSKDIGTTNCDLNLSHKMYELYIYIYNKIKVGGKITLHSELVRSCVVGHTSNLVTVNIRDLLDLGDDAAAAHDQG